ncbi:MAG: fused MFS/spermidine synthase, partial [Rhodobacteraceae bacterium]|nr:fused MFS/spermidine synthase [Paracoccaceae bacterium]
PAAGRVGAWLFLAFVPSSLMLGVTSKISTDIGSFPLVWVVPLALYLLTFVLAFSNRPPIGERAQRALLVAALVFLAVMVSLPKALLLTWTIAAVLILAFFAVALAAHSRLYALRPDREHLTTFYVAMSVGGALGGLFNSIVAPVVFDQIHELRVTVALAAALLLAPGIRLRPIEAAVGIAAALAAVLPGLVVVKIAPGVKPLLPAALLAATLAAAVLLMRRRGAAPAVTLAALVLAAPLLAPDHVLLHDRSFFGAHTVVNRGAFRVYSNGTTIHGAQFAEDVGAPDPRPLTYYHPSGPLGQVLASPRGQAARRIGIVGLGVGALSCYRGAGQDWHFYEIDRKVDEIARNPALFTYMSSCAGGAPTHLGDARIVLAAQPEARFDILVIDAYSSDAVPVHLTTREAIGLYRDRLAPGGLVLFHITNRYYDISRPLGRAAAELGLAARIQTHIVPPTDTSGALSSIVVALAEDEAALGEIAADPRWQPLVSDGGRVWTDDHANLLGVLR